MKTRRILLVSTLAIAVLLAVLVGVGAWLLNDEAFVKKQLARLTLKYTGRELTVSGPLELEFGRETTLRAKGVSFGNAPWAESPEMARAGRLEFTLAVSSLWSKPLDFSYLLLEDCAFEVLKNAEGVSNWKFFPDRKAKPKKRGVLPFIFDEATITGCSLFIDSPKRSNPLDIRFDSGRLSQTDDDRIETDLSGTINNFALYSKGWLAPASAINQGGLLSHELDIRAGDVLLYSSGTVADIKTFSGVDLKGHFTGPDIARLLDNLALPPLAEGAFDIRAGFDTRDGKIHVDIDGDLGTLDVTADGVLDRLHEPRDGHILANVTGPNLQAFGQTFGVENLVREPFALDSGFRFETGTVWVDKARLETDRDQLLVTGSIATRPDRSDSKLTVALKSDEIGRWAPLLDKPVQELGAISLEGETSVDSNGLVLIDARINSGQSELVARGAVGPVKGPVAPDLDFEFRSDDMPRLTALAGIEGFPSSSFGVEGHARKDGQAFRLDDVAISLDRATAVVNGQLSLSDGYSGSDIEAVIDIPDLGEFGGLFALENWPGQRLRLNGGARLDDQDVHLRDVVVKMDNATATVSGKLALTDDYSGTEINADIDIPNMGTFGPLVGLEGWPGERLQVSGMTRLEGGGMVFRVSDGSMGEVGLKLDGRIEDLDHPLAVDTSFDISLPNLDAISARMSNYDLPPGKFEASGSLVRRDDRVDLGDVRFKVGEIEGGIDGYFTPELQFDVMLQIEGPDVTKLGGLLEVGLDPLPFSGETRLAGTAKEFILEGTKFRSGKSDLSGDVKVERGEQTRISGSLFSHYINLDPWTARDEDTGGASTGSPSKYVFDDKPVADFSNVGMALDLHLSADRVDVDSAPYLNLDTNLALYKNRLEISSFSVDGLIGGTMQGDLIIDGRGAEPRLETRLSIVDMKVELGMKEGQDPATLPTANLTLDLQGTGRTEREMASSLNGRIRLEVGPGLLAPTAYGFFLTDFSTQLFNALNPTFDQARHTSVECAVAAADITSGQVKLSPVIINAQAATIFSQGQIDLDTEKIDISFNSKARTGIGISASDFVNPFIKVGGTLAEPTMQIDKEGTIVKGGLAVATAGLSIIYKSMGARYFSSKDPCGDALREIEKRDAQ